jgi:stage II sporulation protein D
VESYVARPLVRVGVVTDAARASIGSSSEVVVWFGDDQERRSLVPRATFVPVASATAATRLVRVQVGSVADETAAREIAARAQAAVGVAASVRWSPETRTYQVRVGEFQTREPALALAARLSEQGYFGAWVAEDPAPTGRGRLRLLETGEELEVATVVPSQPGGILNLDGVDYRGVFTVRGSDTGLTVVNVLNVEDYVRGVVPNEMSPSAFPQLEALKAQAVAARTYAIRNLGQYEARGYDICATPACQVYRGKTTENRLSDRAVDETRGMTAAYRGAPINALYTSTCGGHTEDAQNIFEGEPEPYLRGVSCVPERSAWAMIRTTARLRSVRDAEGASRDVALLVALGVLDPGASSAAALKGLATDAEVRAWTVRLVGALHRRGCDAAAEPPLARRGAFFRHVVASLCWDERGRRLLSPGDPEFLLQVEDRGELDGDGEHLAAALLVQEGALSPYPDNTLRANAIVSRAEAVSLLARAAERVGPPGLIAAEFRGLDGGDIVVRRGETDERHPIEPALRLFRSLEGIRAETSEVSLVAGDKVSLVLRDGRVVYLEVEQSRLGAASDRSSRYFRWEVRLTPGEVARAIARYGEVGAVRDVLPRRIGVSGRVVELAVVGSDRELVLNGLRVRWGLGLRENLFVVDRERGDGGAVERFVFTGKGWGHGVGLCQVGAFGMAQSGATFEQILRHYYTGITVASGY